MVTEAELWAAQLRVYPQSRRLSEQDVAAWVLDRSLTTEQSQRRALMVVLAWQCPVRVWYRTHAADTPAGKLMPAGGWMGCRYGVEDSEYLSGFD